jgi:ATP adenylyltransferase
MVGRVLRNRGVVQRDKTAKTYQLTGYDELTEEQKHRLIEMCRQRLDAFMAARGEAIFDHRRKSDGYISGTLTYEVLKRARFRCELCGTSAGEKALEPDHIIPRNHGGSEDMSNLQALCYSCNAMKRDRDDTDFRAIKDSYAHRVADCLFCTIDPTRIIAENELMYSIRDGFPVTPLHTLIIPSVMSGHISSLAKPRSMPALLC